jgi:hypothetical protein
MRKCRQVKEYKILDISFGALRKRSYKLPRHHPNQEGGVHAVLPDALTVPGCMTKPAFLGPQLGKQVRSILSSYPKVGNGFLFQVTDMLLVNGAYMKAEDGRDLR